MKKNILIMYAKYGSGHESIAKYINDYLKNNKKYNILLLDVSPYANKSGKIGLSVMNFVCKHRPEKLFDFCYDISNGILSNLLSSKYAKISYDNDEIRNIIKDFNPTLTISTHFYCSNIIALYNDLKLTNSKIMTVITDYHHHEAWTSNHEKEDYYIVANDIVKKSLIDKGVKKEKVYSFGLPLNTNHTLANKEDILIRYNVNNGKKNILFFGGSSAGSLYYLDYLKILLKHKLDINIIFICGKNEKLKQKAEEYVKKHKYKNITILGYTHDVINLLSISYLVITKPGGATLTECMLYKTPMLLVPGMGGQEKYNARFISNKKYGVFVKNKRKFKKISKNIINSRNIRLYKNKLDKISFNDSLDKINKLVERILK